MELASAIVVALLFTFLLVLIIDLRHDLERVKSELRNIHEYLDSKERF